MRRTLPHLAALALLTTFGGVAHAAPEDAATAAAEALLDGVRPELARDGVELSRARTLGRAGERSTVRFAQRYEGLPVVGGSAVVRVGRGGAARLAAMDVARDLEVDPTPALDAEAARAAVAAHLASRPGAPAHVEAPPVTRAELVVLRLGRGKLAWQLDTRLGLGGTRFFVDAQTGEVIYRRSLATHAQGRVYLEDAISTPTLTDVELPLLDVADPLRLNGWGGLLRVTNHVSGTSQDGYTVEQTLGPSSGEDFLFDRPEDALDPTDGLAQVNLYYHLTSVRELFRGFGVSVDDPAFELTAVANAREGNAPLDNAFFSPQGIEGDFAAPNLIAIGQGSESDFAYDSDVFKHEFGHYVTHVAVGYNLGQVHFDAYGLSPHSGSIDEGISDYFACTHNGDPVLGEASLALLGATRDLSQVARSCPDDVFGEVHLDGEIIGAVAWQVREHLGPELADPLVWSAIEVLPDGARLGDFGSALVGAAQDAADAGDLEAADVTAISEIVAGFGLDDCGAVLALEGDASRRGTIIGLGLLAQAFGTTCQQVKGFLSLSSFFHFSRATEADDPGLTVTVDADVQGPGDAELVLYARKGEHVRFSASQGFPEVAEFDYQVALDGTNAMVIDASSDPPFEPGAEYFFVITSTSCPNVVYEVSATAQGGPPPPVGVGGGGAGGGGEGGGEDGPREIYIDDCACSAPGRPIHDAGGFVAVAIGAAWLARRRRTGAQA